jgi:hypothetical protein
MLLLGELREQPARAAARGAAQHAFNRLFLLPFGERAVASWATAEHAQPLRAAPTDRTAAGARRVLGLATLALGAASGAGALGAVLYAKERAQVSPTASQRAVAERNRSIDMSNRLALGLGIGAAAAAVVGSLILWAPWADDAHERAWSLQLTPAGLSAKARF